MDTDRPYITDEEMLAEEPVNSEIQPQSVGAVAGCLGAGLGMGVRRLILLRFRAVVRVQYRHQ
ncbi:hypothetical protein [Paenibacillus taichungensis]|uniref:hypothetical protein n=1 Tax=Paenibacillus taichungensis TaxID=484184 RepID=UPI0011BE89C6|nr:hypothetical protein [Paenibacillus taichungensis]